MQLDSTTNRDTAKGINITPVLDKIQDCRSHWLQNVNRMLWNRLARILKNNTKREKKPGETVKENSRHVRLEWVNKQPDSVLAR